MKLTKLKVYLPDKLIYDKIEQCIHDFETDISGYKYDRAKIFSIMS